MSVLPLCSRAAAAAKTCRPPISRPQANAVAIQQQLDQQRNDTPRIRGKIWTDRVRLRCLHQLMGKVQRSPIFSRAYSSTTPLQQFERRRPTMIKTDDLDMPISPREHETRIIQRATADRQKQRIEWDRKVESILRTKGHTIIHNTLVNIDKTTLGLIRIAQQVSEDIIRGYTAHISSVRMQLENILQKRWQKYYSRSKISRLDQRGLKVEKSIRLHQDDFSGIQARITELNMSIAVENKQLISAAKELIEYTSILKGETGMHIKINNSTTRVGDASRELEAQLHPRLLCEIELELIQSRRWQPVSELGDKTIVRDAIRLHRRGIYVFDIVDCTKDKTALALQNLIGLRDSFAPYEVTHSSMTVGSKFGRLLHFYRSLDLSTRAEKRFPGMRYNEHWANITYIDSNMPWEVSNAEFKGFLFSERARIHHMLRKRLTGQTRLKNRNQRGESARQLAQHFTFWERLSELYKQAALFSDRTVDILRHHRILLAGGMTAFCVGHPNPGLHNFQCRNFRIADTLMFEHLSMGVLQKNAVGALQNIQKESGLIDDMQHLKARDKLLHLLDNTERSQRMWRREMSQLLSEAKIWSSLHYLTRDRHLLPSIPRSDHLQQMPLTKKSPKVIAITQVDNKQRRPTAWLRDKSFYPTTQQAIFVDYVMSTNALAYVISTIRMSKVVAFDISFVSQSANQSSRNSEIDLLMFATESQVLLIDWSCFTVNDRATARLLLRTIFEEESILKVVNCIDHIRLLWTDWVTNVNNYVNLPLANIKEYVLGEFPVGADVKLPFADNGRVNSTDPRDHFYAFAFRPYAILRVFHVMNSRGMIKNTASAIGFDPDDHSQNSSDEITNGVFGPVFIDRSRTSTSTGSFVGVNRFQHNIGRSHAAKRAADYDYPVDNRLLSSRDNWLNTMSWRLARLQILKQRRTVGNSKSINRPVSPHVQKAYAAYYQFTMFHENLYDIATALGILRNDRPDIVECALRISWAARYSKMSLSERDMMRLKHASRDSDAKISQEELPSLYSAIKHLAIAGSGQYDRMSKVSDVVERGDLPPTRRRRSFIPQTTGFKSVDPPKLYSPSTRTTHELEQSAMMEEREVDWKPKSLRKPLRALRILGNTTTDNGLLTFAPTKPGTKKPKLKIPETVLYQPLAPSENTGLAGRPLKRGYTRVAVLTGYPPRSGIQVRRVDSGTRKRSEATAMNKLFSKPVPKVVRRSLRSPTTKDTSFLIKRIPYTINNLKSDRRMLDHDFN